jgi:hypothetical protein
VSVNLKPVRWRVAAFLKSKHKACQRLALSYRKDWISRKTRGFTADVACFSARPRMRSILVEAIVLRTFLTVIDQMRPGSLGVIRRTVQRHGIHQQPSGQRRRPWRWATGKGSCPAATTSGGSSVMAANENRSASLSPPLAKDQRHATNISCGAAGRIRTRRFCRLDQRSNRTAEQPIEVLSLTHGMSGLVQTSD